MKRRGTGREKREGSFRSRGEEQIARLLDRHRIRYLYEHPLAVMDRGKVRIWYPDFQLPRYGMVIEYFGMERDSEYAAATRKKLRVYEANGVAALLLRSEDLKGYWPRRILGLIEESLVERLEGFREQRDKPKVS